MPPSPRGGAPLTLPTSREEENKRYIVLIDEFSGDALQDPWDPNPVIIYIFYFPWTKWG